MLKEYLSRHVEGLDDDDDKEQESIILKPKPIKQKINDIDELERLAGQLSLSDTQEKVSSVLQLVFMY